MKSKQKNSSTKDPEFCNEELQPTKFQKLLTKLTGKLFGKKPKSLYMVH